MQFIAYMFQRKQKLKGYKMFVSMKCFYELRVRIVLSCFFVTIFFLGFNYFFQWERFVGLLATGDGYIFFPAWILVEIIRDGIIDCRQTAFDVAAFHIKDGKFFIIFPIPLIGMSQEGM